MAKRQPAALVVGGVEVSQPRYSAGNDDLPAGTLTSFRVHYGRHRPIRGANEWPANNPALVQVSGINADNGTVRAWSVGIDGWIPDLEWPTADAAVHAIRNPETRAALLAYRAAVRAADDAERAARTLRDTANGLLRDLTPNAEDLIAGRKATVTL